MTARRTLDSPPDNPSRESSRNTPPPSPPAPRRNTDNRIAYPSPTNYVLANTLKGHSSEISSVAISPDGQLLASGSLDKTIKIWNLGSGRLLRTLTGHSDRVWRLAFSPNGKLLASGSSDKTIKIWNLSNGKLVRTLTGHSYLVISVAFSPDGQTIASGGGCDRWLGCKEDKEDNDIRIWRTQDR